MNNSQIHRIHRRHRGLSLAEMLISLAISAALLAATMVAVDTSFRAYADAADQAGTQSATRMLTNRLLMLIRVSTAHGPLLPDGGVDPPVTLNGNTITSNFIELVAPNGDLLQIVYRADDDELWLITTPPPVGGVVQPSLQQPILGGVTAAQFVSTRRMNDEGLWVLERSSIDLTVMPDDDTTLSIEKRDEHHEAAVNPIRIIASTMPRKL